MKKVILNDFLHTDQFPAAELQDDFVEAGSLAENFHPRGCRIGLDLLHGLLPLSLGLGLEVFFRKVFYLKDIAML